MTTNERVLCQHCGKPIHLEESPSPFTPTWVHEDGMLVCGIELAHPTLPVMDNAVTRIHIASPIDGSES